MGKPGQRAVDILGLQHQSGRCGSRASGRTSKESIAGDGRPTASRTVRFHSFRDALDFVLEVGELAKTEDHHPDISFG
ncbi:MAG TPA: 4a-hydroxytetrahydrobiopterin dehydratase [Blastocatellia bacterium]|jgi:pterin-4a-carbinolamine dehydratase|nr:4a-hydroxytetrahydrobiopterin dehydratase [Blastocatellia bacterium]